MQETHERRYGALSNMLSGVRLISYGTDCPRESDFFAPPKPGLFCGRWTASDILRTFEDTACLAHWRSHGYHDVRIEIENDIPSRYQLSVLTSCGETSELLMNLLVWIEYITIERLDRTYPTFCVENLRLQSPGAAFGVRMPGQDFASSGILRRMFGVICSWAMQLGAVLITGVPQYFHTAYIFSKLFNYIDPEMESIFRAMKRDLLPSDVLHKDVARVSACFEAGLVRRDGRMYLWPTEVQAFALSHELEHLIRLDDCPPEDAHYTIISF